MCDDVHRTVEELRAKGVLRRSPTRASACDDDPPFAWRTELGLLSTEASVMAIAALLTMTRREWPARVASAAQPSRGHCRDDGRGGRDCRRATRWIISCRAGAPDLTRAMRVERAHWREGAGGRQPSRRRYAERAAVAGERQYLRSSRRIRRNRHSTFRSISGSSRRRGAVTWAASTLISRMWCRAPAPPVSASARDGIIAGGPPRWRHAEVAQRRCPGRTGGSRHRSGALLHSMGSRVRAPVRGSRRRCRLVSLDAAHPSPSKLQAGRWRVSGVFDDRVGQDQRTVLTATPTQSRGRVVIT